MSEKLIETCTDCEKGAIVYSFGKCEECIIKFISEIHLRKKLFDGSVNNDYIKLVFTRKQLMNK